MAVIRFILLGLVCAGKTILFNYFSVAVVKIFSHFHKGYVNCINGQIDWDETTTTTEIPETTPTTEPTTPSM